MPRSNIARTYSSIASGIIESKPVDWSKKVSILTTKDSQELEEFLSTLSVHAARLAAYVAARGSSHAAGVKASNKAAAKVRRAIGYTPVRDDWNF